LVKVEIYSRTGCHLCEVAESTVREVQVEIDFELSIIYIDQNPELESQYGEEVPVTVINGERHDFFRVDRERFKSAILRLRR
jgi:glutaredoxin